MWFLQLVDFKQVNNSCLNGFGIKDWLVNSLLHITQKILLIFWLALAEGGAGDADRVCGERCPHLLSVWVVRMVKRQHPDFGLRPAPLNRHHSRSSLRYDPR